MLHQSGSQDGRREYARHQSNLRPHTIVLINHFHLIFMDLESPRRRASICIWNKLGARSFFLLPVSNILVNSLPSSSSRKREDSIFFDKFSRIYFFCSNRLFISLKVFSFSSNSFSRALDLLELFRLPTFWVFAFQSSPFERLVLWLL